METKIVKKYNKKPSLKQKTAFLKIVENGGNVSKAMRDAKYSVKTANDPSKLTNSIGFKMLCEEMGLTDNFILRNLKEDIELKPQNRVRELELACKITGILDKNNENKIDYFEKNSLDNNEKIVINKALIIFKNDLRKSELE